MPLVRGEGTLRSQIEAALRREVRSGRLSPNSALPSRVLARELGVSRGVVVGADEQLIAEEFLVSRPRGRTVAAPRVKRVAWHVENAVPARVQDFKPGVPDVREFPHPRMEPRERNALTAPTDQVATLRPELVPTSHRLMLCGSIYGTDAYGDDGA